MTLIVDLSFAHDALTGQFLAGRGIDGVIGYASRFHDKNMTAANLADWLAAGLSVGLVYEDDVNDMTFGATAGYPHGQMMAGWAHTIGYDLANCVGFAANDRNTFPADLPAVLAYMEAFARSVPHPGYYGDQDSIDWLAARHPEWWFWQSESPAFGHGVSEHAHLLQRYNDPRVSGLQVDANDVIIPGIPLMGEDMFTDADRLLLQQAAAKSQHADYTAGLELPAVAEMRGNVQNIAKALTNLHVAPDPAALAAALAPLIHSVDPAELQAAIAQALSTITVSLTATQS